MPDHPRMPLFALPRFRNFLARLSCRHSVLVAAGMFGLTAGASCLLGWEFGIPRLTDWIGTGISMFANTALCASLSGLALLLFAVKVIGRRLHIAIQTLALSVTIIGSLTLFEHVSGLDLAIDTLLYDRPWGQRAAASPMRMGPPASLSFLILGVGLFFATRGPRARRFASTLAVFPVAIASLSLIGYLFGSDRLYAIVHLTGIAMQTSILLAVLGVGLMAAVPEYGTASLLCRDDAGGMLVRRLLLPIIVLPLLLGWLRIWGEQAGLYDTGFGISILLFSMIGLLLALLVSTANTISRVDVALREREQRYELVLIGAEAAIWDWDVLHKRVMYSPRWKQLRGLSEQDVSDREEEWTKRIHPDDRDRIMKAVQAHFDGHTPFFAEEYRVQHKEGHWIWIFDRGSASRDAAGQVIRMAGSETDISERKRAEEELRQAEERMRSVVDHVVDGIITIDEAGIVESFNPASQKIFGYQPTEVIGQNIKLLMPEPYHSQHDRYLHNYQTTGQAKIIGIGREVVGKRKDGTTFPMDLAVSAFYLGSRRFFTGIVRDITDRKYLEDQLQGRLTELAEADRHKNEFLATLAHELRNPLAPIRNSLYILGMSQPGDDSLKSVQEIMGRQINHMVRLIDDLLEISRVTSGKISLRTERVEISTVLISAVETSKPLIEASGHSFETSLSAEPIAVVVDPIRLSQVVSNLLNNAAKYTEPGGQIWLTSSRENEEVLISVRDTGIGISHELLPQVFQMFSQADKDHKRAQGGLGIGLALAQSLVELHGGRIEVHSEGEGCGSEFIVRLPLAEPPTSDIASSDSDDCEHPPISRSRVLVVDDNQDAAASLAMLLRLQGCEVQVTHDGLTALEAIAFFHPSVVLLDLGMPVMSGYEVARRIRTMFAGREPILIAVTGWGQEDDRRRTKEAGFNFHLVKPVEIGALEKIFSEINNSATGSSVSIQF